MKKKIKKIIMTFAMVLMVMAAVKATTIEAKAAGLFDPVYYAQTYPDVAAALGTDATALYNHYVNFGQKEGRIPYAGGQPGEVVDGIANATAETPAVQTPTETVDIGNGPFWLFPSDEEVDKATFLRRKQELQQQFDAAGYVHIGWTEEQVQARLLSLKEQYPEGTTVGICSDGAGKILNGLYGDPISIRVGWVAQAGDDNDKLLTVDGCVPRVAIGDRNIPANSFLRVGDAITTRGDGTGHIMVVLSRNDAGITVVESNRGGDRKMHWRRFISWNELDHGDASKSYSNQRNHVWHYEY